MWSVWRTWPQAYYMPSSSWFGSGCSESSGGQEIVGGPIMEGNLPPPGIVGELVVGVEISARGDVE